MGALDLKALLPSEDKVQAVLKSRVEQLPPVPLVAARLLEIADDENVSPQSLARVVEDDPSIAARLLQIVNSAAYGSLRRVSSIPHAVVLLGASEIRSIALGISLYEKLVKPAGGRQFDPLFFWQHAIAMAGLCKALAREVGIDDPEEAYVAGLLHDIGKIILEAYGRIPYGSFAAGLSAHDGPVIDREREIIGIGHDEVGAFYCERWEMPESLVLCALLHHHRFAHLALPQETARLVAVVAFADFIAWSQGFGSMDIVRHPVLHPDVESVIPVARIDLGKLMAQMDREVQTTAACYGFASPSAEKFRENLLRANIELGQLNTRYAFRLAGKISSLSRINRSITRPHRSLDPEEIIAGTLEAIHLDFGFDRIFTLQPDPERRHLKATGAYGPTEADRAFLAGLEIRPDDAEGAFIECMRSHVPVLITGKNDAEADFLGRIGSREAGIVPITSNNRVVGIIAMDNGPSGRVLNAADLTAVSIIANEMGMALENARTFEEVRNRASYDGLTGVFNRTTIEQLLEENFNRAKNGLGRLAIAMIDVDFFKSFNDRYGHLAGDSILKLIAGTLSKFSRPGEVVGRYGGEEFLCILKDTDQKGAVRYGERIRGKVEDLGRLLINRFPEHELTVSVGVAEYQRQLSVKEQVIDLADKAMYSSKIAGRNRVMTARLGPDGETTVTPAYGR